jgi:hypothetical protein
VRSAPLHASVHATFRVVVILVVIVITTALLASLPITITRGMP